MQSLTFNPRYFAFAVLLFVIEVLIALFVHDRFIRPYIGDLLVVILIYCFVKSFLRISDLPAAVGVFVFACMIEMLQYFNFVGRLGLKDSKLANIIMGNSFAWVDILAYAAGILIVLLAEYLLATRSKRINPLTVHERSTTRRQNI